MNGLEFVTAFRELPALNGMRIVVVTTDHSQAALLQVVRTSARRE